MPIRPAGKRATMPAKMISEMPLPMPALGDLLAQPHDEDRPRGQGQDGQELEAAGPGLGTIRAPPGLFRPCRNRAMPQAWMKQMTIVP